MEMNISACASFTYIAMSSSTSFSSSGEPMLEIEEVVPQPSTIKSQSGVVFSVTTNFSNLDLLQYGYRVVSLKKLFRVFQELWNKLQEAKTELQVHTSNLSNSKAKTIIISSQMEKDKLEKVTVNTSQFIYESACYVFNCHLTYLLGHPKMANSIEKEEANKHDDFVKSEPLRSEEEAEMFSKFLTVIIAANQYRLLTDQNLHRLLTQYPDVKDVLLDPNGQIDLLQEDIVASSYYAQRMIMEHPKHLIKLFNQVQPSLALLTLHKHLRTTRDNDSEFIENAYS
jgi:hypothetical protein